MSRRCLLLLVNCAVLAKILMLMKGYDQGIFDKVSYFNPQDGGGDKDEGEDETGGREKREADPTGIITITHLRNNIYFGA